MNAIYQDPKEWEAKPSDPLEYALGARDKDVLVMVEEALEKQNARLAFQPVVTAGPRKIAFFEGLIRVLDDTGRVIPAGQFMPVVEETVLGRRIDCAALRCAFNKLRQFPDAHLSLNMSARSIGDGEWRDILRKGLRQNPEYGNRLIFEINEKSAMLLPDVVTRFLAEMQPRGITFALDNFGSGFTSFKSMREFLFDLVKIDKGFVRGVEENGDNQVLCAALLSVCHQFDMFAVAEGVETAAEAAYLTALGVDCLQGFHIGAPKFKIR